MARDELSESETAEMDLTDSFMEGEEDEDEEVGDDVALEEPPVDLSDDVERAGRDWQRDRRPVPLSALDGQLWHRRFQPHALEALCREIYFAVIAPDRRAPRPRPPAAAAAAAARRRRTHARTHAR
jgi:hypothetical protein